MSLVRLNYPSTVPSVCIRYAWVEPLSPPRQHPAPLMRGTTTMMDRDPTLTVNTFTEPAQKGGHERHASESQPDSAVAVDNDQDVFPLGLLTLSQQLSVSFSTECDQADIEISESAAQFALRQPAILTILMQFLPVATGTLMSAALVSTFWYSAAIHNINQVGRSLPIGQPLLNHNDRWQERWTNSVIPGVRRYLRPLLVESLFLNRPAISAILARKRLPAFLRVFHFVDSWHNSESKLRTLLFVLGSQSQPASCLQSGIPLVLDSFLASSPRSAHMGFVWSTMESVLERDAQAILADLASRVARHSGASLAGSDDAEPIGMREMRTETEAMECGVIAGRQAPRHKLAVINRRLVLNVNAWCIRWIAMMQHPKKAPVDHAKKPTVLSSAAIDLALYRIFTNLDNERRAAWDTLLHQILKCTNKWLGIIRAMVRIMDSLLEHENLVLDVMGAANDPLPAIVTTAETEMIGHAASTPPNGHLGGPATVGTIEPDSPSESSTNVD